VNIGQMTKVLEQSFYSKPQPSPGHFFIKNNSDSRIICLISSNRMHKLVKLSVPSIAFQEQIALAINEQC